MSLTMHEMSVALMVRMLKNLSAILEKGAAHASANGKSPDQLLELRLTPDMFPLVRQVQIASDAARGCAARLAGVEMPGMADGEKTMAEVQDRIAKTIAYLESVPAADIDAGAERDVLVKQRTRTLEFKGKVYVAQFALPNFFFHVTTTYALLRAQGVEVGKNDYLGSF